VNDTDRLIARLHELPPDLTDPLDRFEEVEQLVRRQRRRQVTAALVGGVAALALAVPIADQLLPEAAVGPAGGVTVTHSPTSADVEYGGALPGGTRVTHHSEPLTVTRTGTSTVPLGERPPEATEVAVWLDCLSAGEFVYPDGAGTICEAADATAPPVSADHFVVSAYVIPLAYEQQQITIEATEGSVWRLTTAYVSSEVTEWGVNANGDTFGVENKNGTPDLIAVVATNGNDGYAYADDLEAAGGPQPTSPEDAMVQQQDRLGQRFSVPVYASDGETVVGEFVIGDTSVATSDGATTTTP